MDIILVKCVHWSRTYSQSYQASTIHGLYLCLAKDDFKINSLENFVVKLLKF